MRCPILLRLPKLSAQDLEPSSLPGAGEGPDSAAIAPGGSAALGPCSGRKLGVMLGLRGGPTPPRQLLVRPRHRYSPGSSMLQWLGVCASRRTPHEAEPRRLASSAWPNPEATLSVLEAPGKALELGRLMWALDPAPKASGWGLGPQAASAATPVLQCDLGAASRHLGRRVELDPKGPLETPLL